MRYLVGIVQGRLSLSPRNRLQFFPKNWRKEFQIAKDLGYDFIEFFSERKFNKKNPIWSNLLLNEYTELAKINKLKILNFCDDYIISNSIKKKKTQNYLTKLLKRLSILKIKNLILPMYGKSNLTDYNYSYYVSSLKNILKKNKRIKILIESNISPNEFKDFRKMINSNRLKFLFDTGNRINLKRDIYQDFDNIYEYIEHIHIKDKNSQNQNVKLNSGLVNFKKFFEILKKKKYKKNFTFETTRSNNPITTAKYNLKFLRSHLGE